MRLGPSRRAVLAGVREQPSRKYWPIPASSCRRAVNRRNRSHHPEVQHQHVTGAADAAILLSFAQFERELIGERTRDKMAAARKKGKWVGGYPVLGYDVDPGRGRLVVNEEE